MPCNGLSYLANDNSLPPSPLNLLLILFLLPLFMSPQFITSLLFLYFLRSSVSLVSLAHFLSTLPAFILSYTFSTHLHLLHPTPSHLIAFFLFLLSSMSSSPALTIPIDCINHLQSDTNIVVNPCPSDICNYVITDKHWFIENILCLLSNATKYSSGRALYQAS